MSPALLLAGYCLLILLASLAGGGLPLLVRLTHTRVQVAMSFVGGAMLGVGLLHLLPHAFFELGAIYPSAVWLMAGFLCMFFIERLFRFHRHDPPGEIHAGPHPDHAGQAHFRGAGEPQPNEPGWGAALVGLALHSTLEGIALGASVAAESKAGDGGSWAGLVVFLAIFLHKPFDALTLGTLMAVAGRPARMRHLVNTLFALATPLGVILFQAGVAAADGAERAIVGAALAFAAGTFLCISTSDLLPELHFHSHDRVKLSAALLLGLALAGAIVIVEEAGHDHGRWGTIDADNGDRDHPAHDESRRPHGR